MRLPSLLNGDNAIYDYKLKYVLVGASGTGKSTMAQLLESMLGMKRCITSTTRPPRAGERDGVDYHFLKHLDYESMFEYARFGGFDYGVTHDALTKGDFIILEPKGVAYYRQHYPKPLTVIQLKREGIQIDAARRARDKEAGFDHVDPDVIVRGETIPEMFSNLLKVINEKEASKMKNEKSIVYIDGNPYDVRIPNGADWDSMLNTLGEHNPMNRPDGMYSWCQDAVEDWSLHRLACRFQTGQYQEKPIRRALECSIYSDVGFRPVLTPLDPQTLRPAPERLQTMGNGTVITMGCLQMNGEVQHNPARPFRYGDIPSYRDGAQISIGATSILQTDDAINWVVCNGELWADRVLMRDISWNDLDRNGLVFSRSHEKIQQVEKKPGLDQMIRAAETANTKPPPSKTTALEMTR